MVTLLIYKDLMCLPRAKRLRAINIPIFDARMNIINASRVKRDCVSKGD